MIFPNGIYSSDRPCVGFAVRTAWRLAFVFVLLLSVSLSAVEPAQHKLRVANDPGLAAGILAQGGRLLVDYGAYQLYASPSLSPNLAADSRVEISDHFNIINLNASPLDTSLSSRLGPRAAVGAFAGQRLHLIHFAGPILPAWHTALLATGIRIVGYLPENAYLVYGDAAQLAELQARAAASPLVQWEGAYLDQYRLPPAVAASAASGQTRDLGTDEFTMQLVADEAANPATLQLLEQVRLAPLRQRQTFRGFVNIIVRLPPSALARLAAQPDVISIQPWFPPQLFDERQAQIIAGNLAYSFSNAVPNGPGYLGWLAAKGFTQDQFTASGFSVDVSDSGVDNGTTSPTHFGLHVLGGLTNAGRVAYNLLQGTPNSGSTIKGCDGHGTLNAHIIGGYDDGAGFPFADSDGYHYGLGICPFVLVGSSVIYDFRNWTNPDFVKLAATAYRNGARISNNSWGSTGTNAAGTKIFGMYDSEAQFYDALVRDAQPGESPYPAPGNQEMTFVFSAGNSGPGAGTIGPPGTAKNVLTIGASDGVQAYGPANTNGVPDSQAVSANDIASFSSHGPCADGRVKPDLMAPGTHISGGLVQSANPGTNGTADACFNASGVTGGVNMARFFPANQQFYTVSSGTSHSAPCVSGGCALLRQYFLNLGSNAPSPAMTKAFLLNSARYLIGYHALGALPSTTQGMGEMNLGLAFDGVPRLLWDQSPAHLFTASGQSRTFSGTVADPSQPFRVTLAWTDAPGSTTGNSYNNNLDLLVTIGGKTYKGNVFNGANSTNNGTADAKNNAESVFLPAGVTGGFTVQVLATSINSDGVPNNDTLLDQDFALVIYNAFGAPAIAPQGFTLAAENCAPANGALDPGETVTVNFSLLNSGPVNPSNLVATLLPNSGVLSPGPAQSYGALPAGGPAVSEPFTFTVAGTCGGTVFATLQLQDGTNNLGNVTFSLPLGQFVTTTLFAENFDAVTAPALPAGWTSTASGGLLPFTNSPVLSDTPPNAVTIGTPLTAGSSFLVSPAIPVPVPAALLTFRHVYNFEAAAPVGYDGGVLELQIGSGAFVDILTAGGSFLSGGYTFGISSDSSQPLNGRQAWSSSSGGFVTTQVRLPAATYNQTIHLRWRVGTDTGNDSLYDGGFWRIDSVSLTDTGSNVCCSGTPSIGLVDLPSLNPAIVGQPLTYAITLTNSGALGSSNLAFTDTLPGGVALVSAPPGLTLNAGNLTGFLAPLGAYSATNFAITILPASVGVLTNLITVQSGPAINLADTNLLTVVTPPVLSLLPADQTIALGADAVFQVQADGTPPLAFQWSFNGVALPGATDSQLALTNVQAAQAGAYSVAVQNPFGTTNSPVAHLRVLVPPSLTSLSSDGFSIQVEFQSVAGLNYTLEFSDSLAPAVWQPLPPATVGTGDVMTLVDPAVPTVARFYRIRCE